VRLVVGLHGGGVSEGESSAALVAPYCEYVPGGGLPRSCGAVVDVDGCSRVPVEDPGFLVVFEH
jgi:hypothetical protein